MSNWLALVVDVHLFILFGSHHHHAGRPRSANSLIIIRPTTFHTSWYVRFPATSSIPAHIPPSAPVPAPGPDDDDDDDFDEDSIPAFTHPHPPTTTLPLPLDKGKGRAQDTLLSSPAAAAAAPNGTGSSSSSSPLAGNIGSPANGTTPKADRRTVGGVRVETRCVATYDIPLPASVLPYARNIILLTLSSRSTGVDTLDEPVSATIVRSTPTEYPIFMLLIIRLATSSLFTPNSSRSSGRADRAKASKSCGQSSLHRI